MPIISKRERAALRSITISVLFILCTLTVSPAQSATGQAPESAPVAPRQSASTSDRSSLPLAKALLGHWVTGENTHYYYSESKFISVFAGHSHTVAYTIEAIDEKARTLRMKITTIHFSNLTFSPNKKEISDVCEIDGIKSEKAFKWQYVDESLTPSAEVLKSTETGDVTIAMITMEPEEKPQFIIGDRRAKVYYWRGCPAYDTLPLQRKIYFKTRKDAEHAGYRAATNCP